MASSCIVTGIFCPVLSKGVTPLPVTEPSRSTGLVAYAQCRIPLLGNFFSGLLFELAETFSEL